MRKIESDYKICREDIRTPTFTKILVIFEGGREIARNYEAENPSYLIDYATLACLACMRLNKVNSPAHARVIVKLSFQWILA